MQLLLWIHANVVVAWLVFGTLLILIETTIVQGIGCFFAGLAAIVTAALVKCGVVDGCDYAVQAGCFCVLTALWTILLWQPIKNLYSRNDKAYSNIVGTKAIVMGDGLNCHQQGQVRWSGTIMNARIAEGSKEHSIAGSVEVEVVSMVGNTLFVDIVD